MKPARFPWGRLSISLLRIGPSSREPRPSCLIAARQRSYSYSCAPEGTNMLKCDGIHFANHYGWEATFNAGDGWLKNLSFTIENVSNQR